MRSLKKIAAAFTTATMLLGTMALSANAEVINYNTLNQYNDDQPIYLVDLDEAAVAQGFDLTSIYGFNVYITWADVSQIDFVEAQLSYNGDASGWVRVGGNIMYKSGTQVEGSTYRITYQNDAPLYTEADAAFAEIQIESYYADFTVEKAELLDADGNVIATIQCNGAESTGAAPIVVLPALLALASAATIVITRKYQQK